jgi:hypothetical protein
MRNNNLDLASLRVVAKEAEQDGLMVCLSARTLNMLLDKLDALAVTQIEHQNPSLN